MQSELDKDTNASSPASGNAAKEQYLTTQVRLDEAVMHTRMTVNNDAAGQHEDPGTTSPRARWRRAVFFAIRLGDPDKMLEGAGTQESDTVQKNLEEQHWLEMIDLKHRYGSNLKFYHKQWQDDDTRENFFKWLDDGRGKTLDLKECPRNQLERERIIYLSTEQRLNYMVEIDGNGRLRWAHNKELVDTTPGRWKDAGNGGGIVPMTAAERTGKASRSDQSPQNEPENPRHYLDRQISGNTVTRYMKSNFTRKGIMLRLLRRTVKADTWIYVSDKNFNIFVGIKVTGQFQHSSFLAGGIATSAGLITVKHGLIRKLSPLSGHYRTSINHYRQFVQALQERGVDMHKAELSKAEMALWGIEHWTKWKKTKSHAIDNVKEKASATTHKHTTDHSDRDDGKPHETAK